MKKHVFKYVKMKNFFCFGEEGIEINFQTLGNIVLIRGRNLDVSLSSDDDSQEAKESSNGAGKCFAINTPIRMYDGSVKMVQNIIDGEKVMGDDSTPRLVSGLVRGKSIMYSVVPINGENFVVNGDHILVLKSTKDHLLLKANGAVYHSDNTVTISVSDFFKSPRNFQHSMRIIRVGVDYSSRFVSIDPYVFGIWLGNKSIEKQEITTASRCIEDEAFLRKLNTEVYAIENECEVLTAKIPSVYMINDRRVRLAVLAGLLDSDGCLNKKCFSFVNESQELVDQICSLARSLGFVACVSLIKKRRKTIISEVYRVVISGDVDNIPVKISRKQVVSRIINEKFNDVKFFIEELSVDDYYGFSVDGNHRFLLHDYTVTHNSSTAEGIVYGLFGKTIKRPKKISHADVINNKSGKKLYVEVQWDEYRLIRTRKPDSLRLWKSIDGVWDNTTEITLGGMPATQNAIEEIVGMSYETFVSVVVFTDDNSNAFLECDTSAKRQIVENLLSLDRYRSYSENVKAIAKANKDKIKLAVRDYENLIRDRDLLERRIGEVERQTKEWRVKKLEEIKQYAMQVISIKTEISQSDAGKAALEYADAQVAVPELEASLEAKQTKQTKIQDIIDSATEQYHKMLQDEGGLALSIKQSMQIATQNHRNAADQKRELASLMGKNGTKCPTCYGMVQQENCTHITRKIEESVLELEREAEEAEITLAELKKRYTVKQNQITILRHKLNEAKNKVDGLQDESNEIKQRLRKLNAVPKPDIDKKIALLQQKMEQYNQQIFQRKEELQGTSPYEQILKNVTEDLTDKRDNCSSKEIEIKDCEADLPYLDYWIKAFGDTGIRRFIVSGIVPVLNGRIAYWLQYLIDNKLTLTFDDQLEDKIERNPPDGTQYLYHVLSNGQRRRLNLAVSQAFAYVQTMNTGSSPSVVFLDEVTTNIDPVGVVGIYNMICELSKDKQVFVTTHDQDLLAMLSGCDTIWLEMKDGVSTLASV